MPAEAEKIEKNLAQSAVNQVGSLGNGTARGQSVYTLSQLLQVTGQTKQGERVSGNYQQPLFYMTIDERNQIFELCAPVFGIVTGRMQRISGTDYWISPKKKHIDRLVEKLKTLKELYVEFPDDEVKGLTVRFKIYQKLKTELPELKSDLSNFDRSVLRLSRRLNSEQSDKAEEIQDWLKRPNINVTFIEFIKQFVKDLQVHGTASVYKEYLDQKLENFYMLPGGSVFPVRSDHAGGYQAFIQFCQELRKDQIFFADEISFNMYLPDSAKWYGNIPLECLINKVAEYMLTDTKLANEADGTKPPEKAVVFGENSPFGNLGIDKDLTLPMDEAEQKRVESKVNEARKNAIITLSGIGTPMLLDLSRENLMPLFTDRQRSIIRDAISMAFNVSPNELGMTGSEDVSGRATAESQENIDRAKGSGPIYQQIEEFINNDILPFRYGSGYEFKFGSADQGEDLDNFLKELNIGTTVNEIREQRGKPKFDDDKYNKPFLHTASAETMNEYNQGQII